MDTLSREPWFLSRLVRMPGAKPWLPCRTAARPSRRTILCCPVRAQRVRRTMVRDPAHGEHVSPNHGCGDAKPWWLLRVPVSVRTKPHLLCVIAHSVLHRTMVAVPARARAWLPHHSSRSDARKASSANHGGCSARLQVSSAKPWFCSRMHASPNNGVRRHVHETMVRPAKRTEKAEARSL